MKQIKKRSKIQYRKKKNRAVNHRKEDEAFVDSICMAVNCAGKEEAHICREYKKIRKLYREQRSL